MRLEDYFFNEFIIIRVFDKSSRLEQWSKNVILKRFVKFAREHLIWIIFFCKVVVTFSFIKKGLS